MALPTTAAVTLDPYLFVRNGTPVSSLAGTDLVLCSDGTAWKTITEADLATQIGGGGGSGTVTTVSVATANGLAGTVATATTTPVITLTTTINSPFLAGNGTAISAATIGTGVATALAINVGSAGAFVTFNGALGTPSGGTLTNCTGLPTILAANEATDTTCFIAFFTAATGELGPKTNASLTFNSNTASLGCTTFVGALTGNASTATALQTARAIYGNNFDGTAALTQVIASTYGGTGNGFTKFTGPTTAEKTFTLPDASSTLLYSGGALGTPSGGTATNLTGTASGLTAGNVTTNANLTGALTSSGNATTQICSTSIYELAPADGTITLCAKAAFGFTINELRGAATSAGTITWAIKINGTNVTGLSAVAVTSTPQDVTATAANVVATGDRVTLVKSSTSAAANMEATLKFTRT